MEPGRVVADRYEILRPIAEGASSTVWEAQDALRGEAVAVKAVSMEQAGWRAEVRDRFQQEARLLQLAQHEHLVGVRDIGETDDGFLYLVLDRLSGETLADRLARPPRLPWREAAAIAVELAGGLAALHARGIVHRDLKPANVILHDAGGGARPTCKIIDLGISKTSAAAADPVLFATLTATGQVLGTPEYMSYEQALGERDVDARADVWALGVVLYEMLAARRPFEGQNPNAVLAAIRRGTHPRLAAHAGATPPALIEVVERCLSRARTDRYADGEVLRAALAAAVARGEAEARRAVLRRRVVIGCAAVIAAAVTVIAARALRDGTRAQVDAPVAASAVTAMVTAAMNSEPAQAAASATASAPAESATATAVPTGSAKATSAPAVTSPPTAAPAKGGKPVTRVNNSGI